MPNVCELQSKVCEIQIPGLLSEGNGCERSLLLEEIREMGNLFEAQGVSNFRNIPVGLLEEDLGLLHDATADDIGGGFAGVFF